MSIKWHFREVLSNEMKSDPAYSEFFRGTHIIDRLVRESLQNSLDARWDNNEPVEVRFSICEKQRSNLSKSLFFEGLSSHLEAAEMKEEGGLFEGKCLIIEDFNTRGLNGDPEEIDDNDSNDFYYFFRNMARTGKESNKGGSWGIGKSMFAYSSRWKSFFGLTVRSDDNKTLLMGLSTLKQHDLDGKKYDSYGYFSKLRDKDNLQLPIGTSCMVEKDIIDNFQEEFQIKRTNESGLSIIIPFLNDEEENIGAEDIAKSVIQNYFYPIVAGKLKVEIFSENHKAFSLENDDSIKSALPKINWGENDSLGKEDILILVDMAFDEITFDDSKWVNLDFPSVPSFNEIGDIIADKKEDLARDYHEGRKIYAKVSLPINQKNIRGNLSSHFKVIIEKNEDLSQGKSCYVRGNLAIHGLKQTSGYRVRCFVHIDEGEKLAHLLRDTEEPSHSDWNLKSKKAEKNYRNVEKTVRFVKNFVKKLLEKLSDEQERREERALIDIFNVDVNDSGKGTEPPPPPPSKPRNFDIKKVQGGFSIFHSDEHDMSGKVISVEVAYDTLSGRNKFSAYNPHDFRLDQEPIKIKLENCTCDANKNKLEITVEHKIFKVIVAGFDKNRDIAVKADKFDFEIGSDA